VLIFGVAAP